MNDIVMKEGDSSNGKLYILIKGKVGILKESTDYKVPDL